MATTKEKLGAGFLVLISALSGFGINELGELQGSELFVCESKGIISDCINGVKADGQRCYHNPENGRDYEYCKEGWMGIDGYLDKFEQPAEKIKTKANGREWECNVKNGEVDSYTKCYSGEREGYLGEFV